MNGRGLLDIRRFMIPASVLDRTLEVLATAGERGVEGMVVWGAIREDAETLRFAVAYVPHQAAYKTEFGLLVRVEDEALHQVNRDFHERGLILAGQAHSHPGDAYHSETDDLRPLVSLIGGLSLVVPDFARGGRADVDRFAWFRLAGFGDWRPAGEETGIVVG
jgi:hypothetical protein